MKFGEVPLDAATGKILAHSVLDASGHRILFKGRVLSTGDIAVLREQRIEQVIAITLESTDLTEDEGARRVAVALAGTGVRVLARGAGRGNLLATVAGPLRINVPVLERINNMYEGITVATLREHTVVDCGQLMALVKIIPFGIPASFVADVEAISREAFPVISIRALKPRSVGLVVSGPASAEQKLLQEFEPPVRTRIERYGSQLNAVQYVAHRVENIAAAIRQQIAAGRELVVLAGVSAIVDRDDVAPQAVWAAGGSVTHFGVPVDPGSLLMLGYAGPVPVIGVPGCVRSLKVNVVDWVLPRLLAGERLTRADLVAMGHGGLLEDTEIGEYSVSSVTVPTDTSEPSA